jgi:O-antigen/teichoic acid export membrane protein
MPARRLVQSSSLYLISNLASRAVGFLMLPLYSRFLTPSEYGVVELIELTVQIVALCIGLQSIGGAMIRIFHEASDTAGRNRVVSTAVIGAVTGNMILVIAGMLLAHPISIYVLHSPGAEPLVRMCLMAMMFPIFPRLG